MSILEQVEKISEELFRDEVIRELGKKCRKVYTMGNTLICEGCVVDRQLYRFPEASFKSKCIVLPVLENPMLCDVEVNETCRIVKKVEDNRIVLELECENEL